MLSILRTKGKKIYFFLFVLFFFLISNSISYAFDSSAVRVYRGVTDQSVESAILTKLEFNFETYDEQEQFNSIANFRFTAKEAGKYNIKSTIRAEAQIDDVLYQFFIYKNGVNVSNIVDRGPGLVGDGNHTLTIDDDVALEVNDYIEIWLLHYAGVNFLVTAGSDLSYLSIHKLGDQGLSEVATAITEFGDGFVLFAGIIIFFISFILLIWYFKPRTL